MFISVKKLVKNFPNLFRYVYGARSTAAKTRRCGECEGCNREDCGKCVTCLDKPKFGGKSKILWRSVHHMKIILETFVCIVNSKLILYRKKLKETSMHISNVRLEKSIRKANKTRNCTCSSITYSSWCHYIAGPYKVGSISCILNILVRVLCLQQKSYLAILYYNFQTPSYGCGSKGKGK